MYLIVVYDVNVERIDKVRIFLKQYLNWIQNSVFEGKITKSQFDEIKTSLFELLNPQEDSVILFKIRTKKAVEKEVIGIEKGKTNRII